VLNEKTFTLIMQFSSIRLPAQVIKLPQAIGSTENRRNEKTPIYFYFDSPTLINDCPNATSQRL
jgi:hypothetical protein